jgi:hypothetical protein
MKKAGRRFGSATRTRRRAADGMVGGVEVGDDALVCCIRPKGRAEWVSFGGSEGEMKMGRAMKWAESQGGCSINSLFFVF